jgi:hypothetical protein
LQWQLSIDGAMIVGFENGKMANDEEEGRILREIPLA